MSEVAFRDLGLIDYPAARELQLKLNLDRQSDSIPDTILFCTHPPVITLGRGFLREPSLIRAPAGVPVIEVERGGLATYHGPGQLVVYPILKIDRQSPIRAKHGVVDLIRFMETWTIQSLLEAGIKTRIIEGKTGVWTQREKKIASIGIALKRWVSMHGLSVNLSVGPEPWQWLNPCGFTAADMTDLETEIQREVSVEAFTQTLKLCFARLWMPDQPGLNKIGLAPSVN